MPIVVEFFSICLFLATASEAFTSCAPPRRLSRSARLYANEPNTSSRRDFFGIVTIAAAAITATSSSASASKLDRTLNSLHQPEPRDTSLSAQTASADPTAIQESISGFISGTAVSAVKTIVKYPLDTATVRLQMPSTEYTLQNLPKLFEGSFDGISGPLLSNIPAGAIFFAVKDAIKSSMKGAGLPIWASTSIAVAAALPPYWLIRNPSEVIKTRLQVDADGYADVNMIGAYELALSQGNVTSLYKGYPENVIYGFPADIIKFLAYDYLSGGKKDLSPATGAIYGALSTGLAQFITTPLDVARNRIMAEVKDDSDSGARDNYVERLLKIADEEGIETLFAGTTPRIAKAMLSGALQFAAYEETKQKITSMFTRR